MGIFGCGGLLTTANIYNKTQVDNLLSGKQHTITSSNDLTINKLITRTWEHPTGFTGVQIKADQVYLGNPVWLTGTSISVKFGLLYMLIKVLLFRNGITICMYNGGSPNQFCTNNKYNANR
ncbi:MAG: hypothetical protein ACKPKO_14790 [Candidatus Fonsibacter sp.]